jgi:hypothetical protein
MLAISAQMYVVAWNVLFLISANFSKIWNVCFDFGLGTFCEVGWGETRKPRIF